MRLVTFVDNGAERLGAVYMRQGTELVLDLNRHDPKIPADTVAFLEAGDEARRLAQEAVDRAVIGPMLHASGSCVPGLSYGLPCGTTRLRACDQASCIWLSIRDLPC